MSFTDHRRLYESHSYATTIRRAFQSNVKDKYMLAGALNIQLLLGKSRQMFYIATEAKGNTVAVTTQYFEQTPSKKSIECDK